MGIVNDRGRSYWVKRVPKRFAGLVVGKDGKSATQLRQALHTDSKVEAQAKAAQVEVARMAECGALAMGHGGSARAHFDMAQRLAQVRGFQSTLLEAPMDEVLERVKDVQKPKNEGTPIENPAVIKAILGTVPNVLPNLSVVLNKYFELTKTRHLRKSKAQKRRWVLPKRRADALRFRTWWSNRIEVDGLAAQTANKEFGHLAEVWSTWTELTGNDQSFEAARASISFPPPPLSW